MDADSKTAGAEATGGEERMFDEQGAPVGPATRSVEAEGALPGATDTRDAAGLPSKALAEEQRSEAEEAPGAEATPSPAANYTSPNPTIAELKEKIMATAPTNNGMKQATDTVTSAMNEAQTNTKAAYEKGTEAVGELTDFAKGNVEAVVESSKIIASGMQEIGRTYAEEAKAAYEQMTADLKELAAIKSPTELFQLQGKIMRRNFDTLVATSSKSSEAMMKLANDAFAPLSGRVNVAAEKISKVG